jgi:diguanylate cyclase (GGDEF)-like protein
VSFPRGADRRWLVWLAGGALAVTGYLLVPWEDWVGEALYDGLGLVSAIMIVLAVRWHRPARPAAWYLFAAGQALWVVGDVLFSLYRYALHEEPFPSIADVFYLAAYPLLIAGLALLIRGRSAGRDRAGLLDAGILATGLALLSWTFLMRPITLDASLDPATQLISLAYPIADVLMLAMAVRLFTTPGARSASYRLLVGALLLLLGSDVAFSVVTTFASYTGGLMDAGWLLSYVVWAAAALHPSMRSLSEVEPAKAGTVGRGRLVLLAATVMLAPAVLLEEGLRDPDGIDWVAIAVGGFSLSLLVLARAWGLVAQIQRQAARLSALALVDDLTGLANRRRLEGLIRTALAGRTPSGVQVILFDLDDFKAINDRLGHHVGDRLLIAVGERARAAVRPTDTVARLGGDEFAILLPATSAAEADEIIDRLAERLRRPFLLGDHQLLVGASVGATDDAGTTDPFELLRRADLAMYAAKAAGTNRYQRFRPELDCRAHEHARLGAELRTALDRGQFALVYQPIVTLPDGRLTGVEALVRWQHPERGPISPLEFIPVAERNGLIVELGDWVLRRSCQQAMAWRDALGDAAPDKISVNVSPRQLAEPGFATRVAAVLAETGLPPRRLVIEVTETAVFGGGQALVELAAIRELGVRVALDDFGTGHSSLRLLQTCPADVLKVDKTFVDRLDQAGEHSVIAAALIDIATGLRLTAVAEGVETADQARRLHQLGYRYAQGYHFGRPMPPADLTALLRPSAAAPPPLRPPRDLGVLVPD